jgi:hypothetical protein
MAESSRGLFHLQPLHAPRKLPDSDRLSPMNGDVGGVAGVAGVAEFKNRNRPPGLGTPYLQCSKHPGLLSAVQSNAKRQTINGDVRRSCRSSGVAEFKNRNRAPGSDFLKRRKEGEGGMPCLRVGKHRGLFSRRSQTPNGKRQTMNGDVGGDRISVGKAIQFNKGEFSAGAMSGDIRASLRDASLLCSRTRR